MQDLKFYIGNPPQYVNPPDNWQDLNIELSFENDSPDPILNASELIWKAENAATINTWFTDGLSGINGIFNGIPLVIKIGPNNDTVFDGIIDLTTAEFNCDIVKVKIFDINIDRFNSLASSIKFAYLAAYPFQGGPQNPPNGIPYINPTIRDTNGILTNNYNPGTLNVGDYIPILYQNQKANDWFEIFITVYAIYNLAQNIEDRIEKVIDYISSLIVDIAGLAYGAILVDVLLIVAEIFYILFLLYLFFTLLEAACFMLIPPPMHKLGMFARDLFKAACNYFGIAFKSSIFDPNGPYGDTYFRTVIMPSKSLLTINYTQGISKFMGTTASLGSGLDFGMHSMSNRKQYDERLNLQYNPASSNNIGAYGYYDGTVQDFISEMEKVFNAKAKIIRNSNGVAEMHFERWDYIYDLSTYQLPNASNEAPFAQTYSTNASEISANYMIEYQTDTLDEHTIQTYEGTTCYCTLSQPSTNNINASTLQNLEEKNLAFSRAVEKENFSDLENLINKVYDQMANFQNYMLQNQVNAINNINRAIKALNGVFNSGVKPLPTVITTPTFSKWVSPLGSMFLTNNTTSVPKIFIAGIPASGSANLLGNSLQWDGVTVDKNLMSSGNGIVDRPLSAANLMKWFHYSNLAKTTDPGGTPYYNQWIKYKGIKIPLNINEYETIKNNNIIYTFDGRFARVDSLRWNMFTGMAEIDYRINQKYTDNLSTTFVIDGSKISGSL